MLKRNYSLCCWMTLCTSSFFLKECRIFRIIISMKVWGLYFEVMLLLWLLIAISNQFCWRESWILKLKVFHGIKDVSLPYVVGHFEALPWDSLVTNESVNSVMSFVTILSEFGFFELVILQDRPEVEYMVKIHFSFRRLNFSGISSSMWKKSAFSFQVWCLKKDWSISSLSCRVSDTLNQWEKRKMKFSLDWITGSSKYKIICI